MDTLISKVPTPSYLVFQRQLERNLKILSTLQRETGAKILLAQKCFSMFHFYPLIEKYLSGTASSGLFEAMLADEYFDGENHVYSPAYRPDEIERIAAICDHIVFNSFNQLKKFYPAVKHKSIGLRLNPEHSTQAHAIYDPCSPTSRLGVRLKEFAQNIDQLDRLDGLHIHTLCEQNSDALDETVAALEKNFGGWLGRMKWLNLGGGHHITRSDYDIDRLKRIIARLKRNYDVEIYLEPGEAVALNAGVLVTTVLEVQPSVDGISNVIVDASAACHMPDVIEMPYRPPIKNSARIGEKAFNYRLGAATCLAGDVIGEYSFDAPLREGDRLVLEDMAIYTMVKNNTFNGMNLPAIVAVDDENNFEIVRAFGYNDFKGRLS